MKIPIRPTVIAAVAGLTILASMQNRTRAQAPGWTAAGTPIEYVNGEEVAAGEVLVRLRPNAGRAAIASLRRAAEASSDSMGPGRWVRLRSSSRSSQSLLASLAAHADVERVEPNYIVHATALPNDTLFPNLWGLRNTTTPNADIHAVNAWDVSTGSTSTVVAVIDSGVDYNHPDLAANMWSAPAPFTVNIAGRALTCPAGSHGFNAIAFAALDNVGACNPMDDNNHGTHTAGTIGAVGNNGAGVVGVNWTARIMAIKFLDAGGSGSVWDAINAIDFAIKTKAALSATNGANVRVLSNSWGGGPFADAMFTEIQQAAAADMLFVAAAGNSATNNDAVPFYPASYNVPNVISVAATDINDMLAGFSNYGANTVHLAAPGVGIVSTVRNGGYASASGTSMATPHVSGVANLILSKCTLTTAQLKTAITSNVDVIPGVTGLTITNGRLNADKAIRSCAPPSGGSTTATFLGTDSTARGTWKGLYGADGYQVVGDSTSYPPYATVSLSGQLSYTWTASTSDVRALQKAAAADRLAATWYAGTSFTIDLNFTDGQPHQLGLYVLDWDSTARSQTLEVRDAATNAVLDSRTAAGFNGGQYLRWTITGHVSIRVVRVTGNNAVVSGLFFDTGGNVPPDVALTAPADGAVISPAPATIPLTATASDADGIDRVEFYSDVAGLIGTDTTSPYGVTWSNVPAGSYVLTAKAFDLRGASRTSTPVHVTVSAGGGSTAATFLGNDAATRGTWKGVYGSDGYNIVADGVSYPSYAVVTPSGQESYTWLASTADVRALQKAAAADRLAATWYGMSFSIDINLTDGQPHQVAAYMVDWDSTARVQTVEVRDAATNALLDSQTVSAFNGGQYYKWLIQGHVNIRVTRVAGNNAIVSGLFFDPGGNPPPTVSLTAPTEGAIYSPAPATISLSANASDADGIDRVEFYSGAMLIATSTSTASPYTATWNNVGVGSYTLTAKAYDRLLNARVSAPVHVTVAPSGGTGTAQFLGSDATTQGTWRGAYGGDGYEVVNSGASYPPYAIVAVSGQDNYTWAGSTSDVRALQKATTPSDRLAATWYAAASFSLDVNITDGLTHRLALYFLDWDSFDRAETIEVRDAVTGTLLDSRAVSSFHGGVYLRWTVGGHVAIRVTRTAGVNPVLSGVFFDP